MRWPAWGTEANTGVATPWDEEQVQRRADGGCLGALLPMKDAATRRNALGRGWHPVIQRSPNGATRRP
jgi:hypothetical protein